MWPRGGKKTKQDVEDAEEEVSPRLFLQQSGVSCHHAAIKKSNGISCPSTCTTAGWPAKARPCRQLAGAMPHPSRRNPCCLQALNADASEAVLRVAREQQAELDAEGRAGHAAGGAAARPGAGTVAQPCFFQLLLCHVMLFVWAYLLRLGAQHAVVPMHMPVLRALAGGQSDCCRVWAPLGWMRVSGVMTCKQHGQPKGRKLGLSQKF